MPFRRTGGPDLHNSQARKSPPKLSIGQFEGHKPNPSGHAKAVIPETTGRALLPITNETGKVSAQADFPRNDW